MGFNRGIEQLEFRSSMSDIYVHICSIYLGYLYHDESVIYVHLLQLLDKRLKNFICFIFTVASFVLKAPEA